MSPVVQTADQKGVSPTGVVMVVAVVIIFFIFVFFLILYIRYNINLGSTRSHQTSPDNAAAATAATGGSTVVIRRALEPAVLKSLPVSVFRASDGGIECAVCLSELSDGELFRLLPGCRHGFHLECIDLWFSSNSTCPVCRSSVEMPKKEFDGREEGSSGEVAGVERELDVEQGMPRPEPPVAGVEGEEAIRSS